ncbi:MAG: family 20 glycosylhydrolase, partial [Muribaculaceae bacterium]|nr:family 20 glycosylhydrolase [Muribaculaceae bacterium]
MMAAYGLNVFHFHFSEDEAWRLEIKTLPELAEIGSRRGYTPGSDGSFLPQIFGGDGNKDSGATSNNGFISRDEYISLLRHADSLGIAVIPEIESPGHARAAIKAMEVRARRTGDDSWLLQEPGDTSVYTSAQSFHDNVMNPALEGPYKVINMVADEIADMHRAAGVPLKAIHIGGDEVPRGAWGGSPAVNALKEREGLEKDMEVHALFVKRLASDLAAKGIPTSGWQEIAWKHSEDFDAAVRPQVFSVNCWRTLSSQGNGKVVDEVAAAGYPVVLSNADHFYFDLCYSRHPYERGLTWAGTTDEFSSLSGYPSKLCTLPGANVLGVQGQVWSETIRNSDHLEEMLFPKILGLAERAWNPDSTYSEPDFHAVILNEIPKWEAGGFAYHVRQPGVKVTDGRFVKINSPYPDAEI